MERSKALGFIFFLLMTLASCSSHKKETTVTSTAPNGEVTTSEHTTETTSDGCGGFLSCTVDVIGDVIAWPFRAVGSLFKGIF